MTAGRVAVIGAGIAGLACAERLGRAGLAVEVFDKGQVAGGRMATRRFRGTTFDHGAQYAAARDGGFATSLAEWGAHGTAARWAAASTAEQVRWVGVPAMAAIPAAMAGELTRQPRQLRRVGALHRTADGWLVRHHDAAIVSTGAVTSDGGELAGPFDAALVAIPAPQAAALLAGTGHRFAELAGGARYAPCWAVMAIFPRRQDLPDVRRSDTEAIAWLAREASRPGRPSEPERFVFHAAESWSRERLEHPAEGIPRALLAGLPTPDWAVAHRWRYAKVQQAHGEASLWDPQVGLGCCGDWCLGGRVEAAWQSGRALADAVLVAGGPNR